MQEYAAEMGRDCTLIKTKLFLDIIYFKKILVKNKIDCYLTN